ncbi:ATP-binding cassette domain-containing protein [Chitinophaga oryziterrae]|uniref:ATP-binding cassette domain-containing protein n=1 Tax=Chitinophaga oryziterrae TaxID=1031224 RepID=A0A6N8JB62_9BACT|nr:ABC transporter ATP-binding protein [Chitinophaga oryziterrae]MVT42403.1 ATP-binding cassette domain-containing protein [Chitinophaga oryziterrae]
MNSYIVQVENLSHHFGKQLVLDDVSLLIPNGSIYGFLGPNGAGKTTTLRLILGLLKKQTGVIRVFGDDFERHRIAALEGIGSLIEQPSIYLHLNARENLEIYRLAYKCGQKRVHEVLEMVGLNDVGNKKSKDYSLGMKQRLAIAIALLHNPELLILDEPANGLDPNGIIEMRNLLLHLNREFGKTILISSHLLAEVEKIATDVGIIHKGKLLFQGTLPELHQLQSDRTIIEIEVDDLENAKTALAQLFSFTTAGRNTLQVICNKKEQVAAANDLLVKQGVRVYNLKVIQNDLEALFVQIITA